MIGHFLFAMLSVAATQAPSSPLPSAAAPAPATANPSPPGGAGNRRALFISPMGEPFRDQPTREAGLEAWFAQTDKDGNRLLSVQEMRDDAARFFATLDKGQDREIDPDDIKRYEGEIVPEIHMMGSSTGRGVRHAASPDGGSAGGSGGEPGSTKSIRLAPAVGLKGAGRWGLLNIPQPLTSADANFNRGISLAELQQAATTRYVLLDTNGDGRLSLDELQARLATLPTDRSGR